MNKPLLKLLLLFALSISMISSCMWAPVEISMGQQIKISGKQIDNLIKRNLENYSSFEKLTYNLKNDSKANFLKCKKAFYHWLYQGFKSGTIPKRVVEPHEYGETEQDIDTWECPNFDTEVELNDVVDFVSNEVSGYSPTIDFAGFWEGALKDECTKLFLDPKNERIKITKVFLDIEKNTMSHSFMLPSLYLNTKEKDPNAKQEISLRQGNEIVEALTQVTHPILIPAGFVGELVILEEDEIERSMLLEKSLLWKEGKFVLPLKLNDLLVVEPNEDGSLGFKVPRGEINFSLKLEIAVFAGIGEISCIYQGMQKFPKSQHLKR